MTFVVWALPQSSDTSDTTACKHTVSASSCICRCLASALASSVQPSPSAVPLSRVCVCVCDDVSTHSTHCISIQVRVGIRSVSSMLPHADATAFASPMPVTAVCAPCMPDYLASNTFEVRSMLRWRPTQLTFVSMFDDEVELYYSPSSDRTNMVRIKHSVTELNAIRLKEKPTKCEFSLTIPKRLTKLRLRAATPREYALWVHVIRAALGGPSITVQSIRALEAKATPGYASVFMHHLARVPTQASSVTTAVESSPSPPSTFTMSSTSSTSSVRIPVSAIGPNVLVDPVEGVDLSSLVSPLRSPVSWSVTPLTPSASSSSSSPRSSLLSSRSPSSSVSSLLSSLLTTSPIASSRGSFMLPELDVDLDADHDVDLNVEVNSPTSGAGSCDWDQELEYALATYQTTIENARYYVPLHHKASRVSLYTVL